MAWVLRRFVGAPLYVYRQGDLLLSPGALGITMIGCRLPGMVGSNASHKPAASAIVFSYTCRPMLAHSSADGICTTCMSGWRRALSGHRQAHTCWQDGCSPWCGHAPPPPEMGTTCVRALKCAMRLRPRIGIAPTCLRPNGSSQYVGWLVSLSRRFADDR